MFLNSHSIYRDILNPSSLAGFSRQFASYVGVFWSTNFKNHQDPCWFLGWIVFCFTFGPILGRVKPGGVEVGCMSIEKPHPFGLPCQMTQLSDKLTYNLRSGLSICEISNVHLCNDQLIFCWFADVLINLYLSFSYAIHCPYCEFAAWYT